jgi:hypothetical protein
MQGNGQQNFLVDVDAVAQLIDTSLLLLQGEWFLDVSAGFPLFQQILGQPGVGNNPQIAALLIQETIMGVPFVQSLTNVDIEYDARTRTITYTCLVLTAFGTIQTIFAPGQVASIPVR